jgi:LuxR family maltose regulon positive regulatory protein
MADGVRVPRPVVWRSKLLPPRLGAGTVARPRLVERLRRGLAHPLTLVVAPAGFGKTMLLGEWLAACPCRSAWLSLDQDDTDLSQFVAHLIAALQQAVPNAGEATRRLLDLATMRRLRG